MKEQRIDEFYKALAILAHNLSRTSFVDRILKDGITRLTISILKTNIKRIYDDVKAYEQFVNAHRPKNMTNLKRKRRS
jgi:hypothetical protein